MPSRYYLFKAINGEIKTTEYTIVNFAIEDAESFISLLEDREMWHTTDFMDNEIWRKENAKGDYVSIEYKIIW